MPKPLSLLLGFALRRMPLAATRADGEAFDETREIGNPEGWFSPDNP